MEHRIATLTLNEHLVPPLSIIDSTWLKVKDNETTKLKQFQEPL